MAKKGKGGSKAFLIVVIGLIVAPFVFPKRAQKAWDVISENASKSYSMWKDELSGKKRRHYRRPRKVYSRRFRSSRTPRYFRQRTYSGDYRSQFLRCRRIAFHVTFYYPAIQHRLEPKRIKRRGKWKYEKTQRIVIQRSNGSRFRLTVLWKYSINGTFKLHSKYGGIWVSHYRGNLYKEFRPRPGCIAKGAGDRVRHYTDPNRNCIKPLYHVAADQKRCFGYGTNMYIPAFDGLYVNGGTHSGVFAVGDIGSGVKGCNRIDVFLQNVHQKKYLHKLLKSRNVKEFKQADGRYRLYLYGYVCN